MKVSFAVLLLLAACGGANVAAPEPVASPAVFPASPAPQAPPSASALAPAPSMTAAPSPASTPLFARLPDKTLTMRSQTGQMRVLAKNANWAAVAPDGVHVLVGTEGAARLLPENRALSVTHVNQHSEFSPDGKSLLVAIDDLHPTKPVPTPGYAILAMPSLAVLARFEGNDAHWVKDARIVYRAGKQPMAIDARAGATPAPAGNVQPTIGCTLTDHYGLTLPLGGTPLCGEKKVSTVHYVDRGATGWLVTDSLYPQHTHALRMLVLTTGESRDLIAFDGTKPHEANMRVLVSPDGTRACAGIAIQREDPKKDTYELRCGSLPHGPLVTVAEMPGGSRLLPWNRTLGWLDPGKTVLVGEDLVDLEAKTVQRLVYPHQSLNPWRTELPGGKRFVVTSTSPPLLVDVPSGTYMPVGNPHGEHDAAFAVPNRSDRLILSDDHVPGAGAERGRWLYWVDVGP